MEVVSQPIPAILLTCPNLRGKRLAFADHASVQGLRWASVMWIDFGKSSYLQRRHFARILQYKPGDTFAAGRCCE